jgi:dihydroorotate dehydrogenase (NAD+) catalytic subunit
MADLEHPPISRADQHASQLTVELAGLPLRNPVMTASGTCGYGPEYAKYLDYSRLGAFTTKSVTVEVRPGNAPQRIVEVRAGMLNAIGLANTGLEQFCAEKIPFIERMPTQVFVNVAGHRIDDYLTVCERLDGYDCIAGLELNVSCPNVDDGLMFGTNCDELGALLKEVRAVVKRAKLIVKLSPNVTDITAFARVAVERGVDILSLINTYVGMAIDVDAQRPVLANTTGGLSGPAIKPLALLAVHRVYREVAQPAGVPLIGMGGIQTPRDAIEFHLAGASAVAIGTALFVDPTIPRKIADGVSAYLQQRELPSINDLIGQLKT